LLTILYEMQNSANVIAKNDLHEEAAVDESCSLKYLIVLQTTIRFFERRRGAIISLLVDT